MEFIKTKTSDNLHYTGLLSRAENSDKVIIHIHGMSGDIYGNSFYPFMHNQYPQNGWSFLAGEHRGTHSITMLWNGNEIVNVGNTFETFEDCIKDIQAWVDKAKELGFKKIWLQAHSLGPSKVAYYIYKEKPKDIEGLIFLSPSDMLGLQYIPETIELHKSLLNEAKELDRRGKSLTLLSKDLESYLLSAQTYLNFFSDDSKTAIFNYGKPELGFEVVNNINLPVLAFTGTNDDGIVTVIDRIKQWKY